MKTRRIGPFEVSAVGFGCMSLSHAYGAPPDPATGARLLNASLDLGYAFLDTAALYGFGANETLIGNTLKRRRDEYILASKCGMTGVDGKRVIDGRPATLKRTCEESLGRLRTDIIDIYYLHRWDRSVPIEDSVGALADLLAEGKIGGIGLSEVSADTIRRAHRVHPIAAVQSEYSLWTRNPQIAVFEACRALDIGFAAFSPVGRGFFGGGLRDPSAIPERDIRRAMPRFQGDNFVANLALVDGLSKLAREKDCTSAQLALAWVLAQEEFIVPIPGTTSLGHLAENAAAPDIELDAGSLERLAALFAAQNIHGSRYNAANQAEIDTEEWPA